MKKLLLIVGIAAVAACAVFLFLGILSLLGYHNVADGSPELYSRLHGRMAVRFLVGGVFAAVAVVSFILRTRF